MPKLQALTPRRLAFRQEQEVKRQHDERSPWRKASRGILGGLGIFLGCCTMGLIILVLITLVRCIR